jgi:hypothetical protein
MSNYSCLRGFLSDIVRHHPPSVGGGTDKLRQEAAEKASGCESGGDLAGRIVSK